MIAPSIARRVCSGSGSGICVASSPSSGPSSWPSSWAVILARHPGSSSLRSAPDRHPLMPSPSYRPELMQQWRPGMPEPMRALAVIGGFRRGFCSHALRRSLADAASGNAGPRSATQSPPAVCLVVCLAGYLAQPACFSCLSPGEPPNIPPRVRSCFLAPVPSPFPFRLIFRLEVSRG